MPPKHGKVARSLDAALFVISIGTDCVSIARAQHLNKNGVTRAFICTSTLYQGNLKSTRKARLSPFLSLYFWHKLIRLEPRKMRGGGLKFSQSLVMAPD